jgi:hypothetical protein
VSTATAPRPALTVVRGEPTDAELAALVAVLLAANAAAQAAAAAAPGPPSRPAWADRSRAWFPLPQPGPSSWRASALPH